jgi:hypothetical protein
VAVDPSKVYKEGGVIGNEPGGVSTLKANCIHLAKGELHSFGHAAMSILGGLTRTLTFYMFDGTLVMGGCWRVMEGARRLWRAA